MEELEEVVCVGSGGSCNVAVLVVDEVTVVELC